MEINRKLNEGRYHLKMCEGLAKHVNNDAASRTIKANKRMAQTCFMMAADELKFLLNQKVKEHKVKSIKNLNKRVLKSALKDIDILNHGFLMGVIS